MDNNSETSIEDIMVFEYTGIGCSVPKDVITVRFKEGLKKIGVRAFGECTSLESIMLPSTVTEIDDSAFENCRNLREVAFNNGLQTIGDYAFINCKSLERVTTPPSLVEIGSSAFYSCSNLREVTLNEGLKNIGPRTFGHCKSLESIELPSTVIEIGNYAFNNFSNLREFTLNEGLKKIGPCTFINCQSLKSITLPSTVVEIGSKAFKNCRNLRVVELNGVPQRLKNEAFENCVALERFLFPTMPYRLVNIIQTKHWEDFEDKVGEVRGIVQWESDELFVLRETHRNIDITHQNWDIIKRDFGRITRLVSYYELKEATSMFELALWKFNLDRVDTTNVTNRADYRIDVPGPVKNTMLQYLDHTC